jgi:hypothetical protein
VHPPVGQAQPGPNPKLPCQELPTRGDVHDACLWETARREHRPDLCLAIDWKWADACLQSFAAHGDGSVCEGKNVCLKSRCVATAAAATGSKLACARIWFSDAGGCPKESNRRICQAAASSDASCLALTYLLEKRLCLTARAVAGRDLERCRAGGVLQGEDLVLCFGAVADAYASAPADCHDPECWARRMNDLSREETTISQLGWRSIREVTRDAATVNDWRSLEILQRFFPEAVLSAATFRNAVLARRWILAGRLLDAAGAGGPALVNSVGEDGETLLCALARQGPDGYGTPDPPGSRATFYQRVLASAPQLDRAGKDGATPLACAADSYNVAFAEALVAAGASLSSKDLAGRPTAHLMAARLDLRQSPALVAALAGGAVRDDQGKPTLSAANTSNARLLLAKPDPDLHTDEGGNSPIHYWATSGALTAELLAAPAVRPLPRDAPNHQGSTPVQLAVKNRQINAAELLLYAGATSAIDPGDLRRIEQPLAVEGETIPGVREGYVLDERQAPRSLLKVLRVDVSKPSGVHRADLPLGTSPFITHIQLVGAPAGAEVSSFRESALVIDLGGRSEFDLRDWKRGRSPARLATRLPGMDSVFELHGVSADEPAPFPEVPEKELHAIVRKLMGPGDLSFLETLHRPGDLPSEVVWINLTIDVRSGTKTLFELTLYELGD